MCGDKSGGGEKRFYKALIRKADERFNGHLKHLRRESAAGKKKDKKRR